MIKTIRRENLRFLVETLGRGSQKAAAGKLDLAPSFISQILSGSRNMGEKLARKIEKNAGLLDGAMDAPMTEESHARRVTVDMKALEEIIYGALTAIDQVRLEFNTRQVAKFAAAMVAYYLETGETLNPEQLARVELLKQA